MSTTIVLTLPDPSDVLAQIREPLDALLVFVERGVRLCTDLFLTCLRSCAGHDRAKLANLPLRVLVTIPHSNGPIVKDGEQQALRGFWPNGGHGLSIFAADARPSASSSSSASYSSSPVARRKPCKLLCEATQQQKQILLDLSWQEAELSMHYWFFSYSHPTCFRPSAASSETEGLGAGGQKVRCATDDEKMLVLLKFLADLRFYRKRTTVAEWVDPRQLDPPFRSDRHLASCKQAVARSNSTSFAARGPLTSYRVNHHLIYFRSLARDIRKDLWFPAEGAYHVTAWANVPGQTPVELGILVTSPTLPSRSFDHPPRPTLPKEG
ncbi:uncharacterized protein PFL1_05575 [Pseudozyma flocculosa PF-1]|uniref:Uncharacterized protein n=1 Tax=Pseudozyma flocculosa PF-1 TaxID=1277687 RepID=A0A061H8N2_9BASI|nr:uncharacterized protein PFL1_05575 [Pseudozyma flocculosa PF-1]EPQ26941.1 hypothetical protein PFL1_05575 [Pseudozyma flocculosa PF-1]